VLKVANGKKTTKKSSSSTKQTAKPQLTDAQKKEMKANKEAYEKELKQILSDDQYKTYQNKHAKKSQQKSKKN